MESFYLPNSEMTAMQYPHPKDLDCQSPIDTLVDCMGGEPPYQCRICDKVFTIPARLQRHYRIHTGEKPFKCDFCNKTFSVKENLNVHRRIHTKERPYQCTICDRAFEHSGKLHRHMRTHTGERPHKCDLCGKTFVQSGQLVIHLRAHTGEKPYTCDHCQKGFTCSKQLKVHIRTHTGEKPYECDVCGKTFGYNHVLKMHKMSHMGEKLYKCTLCEEFFNSRKNLDTHIKQHGMDCFKNNPSEDIPVEGSLQSPPYPPKHLYNDHPIPVIQYDSLNKEYMDQSQEYSRLHGSGAPGGPSHPLTPPRTPESNTSTPTRGGEVYPSYDSRNKFQSSLETTSYQSNSLPKMTVITTVHGENFACPSDLLVRLSEPKSFYENPVKYQMEAQEKLRVHQEHQTRIHIEEERRRSEKDFSDSVLRVLNSCIGEQKMKRLGYPENSVDKVIMNTLSLMGSKPCWEPSLLPMDRIKVNLRLLLECCVPDKDLWEKFGWRGKGIEEIIADFIQQC